MRRLYALLALPFSVVGTLLFALTGFIGLVVPVVLQIGLTWEHQFGVKFYVSEWLRGLVPAPASWSEPKVIGALLCVGITSVLIAILLERVAWWLNKHAFVPLSSDHSVAVAERVLASPRRRAAALDVIANGTAGGIHKRIDENRELLELLDREAPVLLHAHPYIIHWIRSNDDFLSAIEEIVTAEDAPFKKRAASHYLGIYPRKWPDVSSQQKDSP